MTSLMTENKSIFYGRRIGRPLKSLNKGLLTHFFPKYELIFPKNIEEKLDPKILFPTATTFSLEIGFGTGTHLFSQAKGNPNTGFIGSEPYLSGVSQLLKNLQEEPLKNILLSLTPVQTLLTFLKLYSLDHIYILFPDPWPKARHNKRRIVSTPMLKVLKKYLKPTGKITISTDHTDYAGWMEEAFEKSPFILEKTYFLETHKRPVHWPITRFENKAHLVGRPCKVYELILSKT